MEKITNKKIEIVDVNNEENIKKLEENGFGKFYCMMIKFMFDDYINGIYDVKSNDLEDLIGHEQTSLEDEIKEVMNAPNYFPM